MSLRRKLPYTSFHLCATKEYIIKHIRESGAKSVLGNFDGTDEEAIAALMKDSRKVIPVGKCSNQRKDGSCGGHRSKRTVRL